MTDGYPEAGEIERDVIAADAGEIERDVIDDESEGEEEYEVAGIAGHKMERGKYKYLVAWKGYGPEHNTWEPEANLEHARDMIDAYLAKQPKHAPKRGRPSSATPSKPAKRGRPARSSQAAKALEDDEIGFQETHRDSAEKFKDVADWEPLVKQVDSIERGSDNTLVVYLTMKSGERICQGRDIVYRRCPQAMLRFYETYLKWRNDD
ncbi:unnamed protein product [Cutaneotrichosporon oleaginosum]